MPWTVTRDMDAFTRGAAEPATNGEWLGREAMAVWEREGAPVSMAAESLRAAGSVRIQSVYTPPAHRRHGYAAAVTAEASARAQRASAEENAAEAVLFTDLANPTSNAIYQRIGHRPVMARVVLGFEGA
jgi:predicted GNAT family acetyltransferase